MKKYRYYIGIDCGTETGFAIWDTETKSFLQLSTLPIHKAMLFIKDWYTTNTFVRVEDARLRKWIPQEKNIGQRVGRAKGAGSVSRDAKIWEDYLTDLKIDFELVPPKNNKTKVAASLFSKMTKWEGRTSNHARDAAMMVLGK